MTGNYMLSTIDNPFNPFEQFTSWFMFDTDKGYNCSSRLARIAKYSDDFTQKEIDEETERAIDRIIELDFLGIYIKVKNENVHEDSSEG